MVGMMPIDAVSTICMLKGKICEIAIFDVQIENRKFWPNGASNQNSKGMLWSSTFNFVYSGTFLSPQSHILMLKLHIFGKKTWLFTLIFCFFWLALPVVFQQYQPLPTVGDKCTAFTRVAQNSQKLKNPTRSTKFPLYGPKRYKITPGWYCALLLCYSFRPKKVML